MNQIEGRIGTIRGDGPIRLVDVTTTIGILSALVLDVGSPDRPFEPGRRVRALFKETSIVAAAPHHRLLEGRVVRLVEGPVLCEMEVFWPCGQRVRADLPPYELPPGISLGDEIRLHVPASAVALELH